MSRSRKWEGYRLWIERGIVVALAMGVVAILTQPANPGVSEASASRPVTEERVGAADFSEPYLRGQD